MIRPPSVTTATPSPAVSRRRTGECSKISTPALLGRAGESRRRACRGARARSSASRTRRRDMSGEATDARTWAWSSRTTPSSPRAAASCAHSSSHSSWCGSVATARAPTRSHSASIPHSAMSAPIASRFAMPRRSSSSISSGQRLRPLSRPWVRLASQNPPLRPDAAQPTVRASTRTMRASGSRRRASSAVHSPV